MAQESVLVGQQGWHGFPPKVIVHVLKPSPDNGLLYLQWVWQCFLSFFGKVSACSGIRLVRKAAQTRRALHAASSQN